jgi:hypothetical protein
MEIILGVAIAVLIIIITRILSKYFTVRLIAATILVAIAFIYVGFSLKDNPVNLIILEIAVALVFYFLAIIGYTRNGLLIAYGIVLHGVWDIFHHNGFFVQTDLPVYWPSFCLTIDIIDGLYFFFLFRKQNSSKVVPESQVANFS